MPLAPRRARRARRARSSGAGLKVVAQAGVLTFVVGGSVAFAQASAEAPEPTSAATVAAVADLTERSREVASRSSARTQNLTVVLRGEKTAVSTAAATVGAALTELGVVLADDEAVSVDPTTPVAEGMEVVVDTVERTTVTEVEVVEHDSQEKPDDALVEGTKIVETSGRDGRSSVTYIVEKVGGAVVSRTPVTSVVESEVRDEVVRVGTLKLPDAGAKVLSPSQARALAKSMVADRGWDGEQFACLDKLWTKESNWRVTAANSSSGAYGIPQAYPGSKMGSVAADWRTNAKTQITWGLGYVSGRYGTPCAAWNHSQARGWY
ncbi:uncharacterized protein DUF348 [Flavimobilis soli]|uniref:Uncharacterized protein DUF348 n=1 Tax=Flavimobilis soli TaxID=442709 RepID=A0A2A9EEL6_9MICO|nr:G5 domain-containing protein [Flavimobilis soli]PFG37487.1 uncharacterized protein DUF348 [Flavimobilis soli]